MLSQVMQDALNEQINIEFFSSYNYLAMSAYCENLNFRGCAHWLRMQSDEEPQGPVQSAICHAGNDCL